MSSADGTAPAEESVLDDVLTPMERSVKTYLTSSVAKDLIELLAVMSVERPDDAHHWLGLKLLQRSPMGPYMAIRTEEALASKRKPRFTTSGSPPSTSTPSFAVDAATVVPVIGELPPSASAPPPAEMKLKK